MTSYTEVRKSPIIVSLENQLIALEDIKAANTPFNISHLNLLKAGLPKDFDSSDFIDLETSMEGLKDRIIDFAKNTYKKLFGKEPPNASTLNYKELANKIREVSNGFEGSVGQIKDKGYIYQVSSADELIKKVKSDLNIVKSLVYDKNLLTMVKGLQPLVRSFDNAIESDDLDEQDEIETKINVLVGRNLSIFKKLDGLTGNSRFDASYDKYQGVSIEFESDWNKPVDITYYGLSKSQANELLNISDECSKMIDSLFGFKVFSEYLQSQTNWIIYLINLIESMCYDVHVALYSAMVKMKGNTKVSGESDVLIEACPIRRIEQCLLNKVPLVVGPLGIDISDIVDIDNKTHSDVVSTVTGILPIYQEIVSGTKTLVNLILEHKRLGVTLENFDVSSLFIKIADPEKCMPPNIPKNLTPIISTNAFESNGIPKLSYYRVRGFNQNDIEVEALTIDSIYYISHAIKCLQKCHDGSPFTTGDEELDKIYLEDANVLIKYIYEIYIPRMLDWMIQSFGV